MSADCFLLREWQGIRYYTCCAFNKLPHVRHGFSTRFGGEPRPNAGSFNLGNTLLDTHQQVNENRRRFLSAIGLKDAPLITLRQIHSNRVHIIEDIPAQWNPGEGDALATRRENIALSVQVADCLPVLIADPEKNAVAAVHSGWRGTLSGILPKTIREMERAFGSNPSALLIAIGPGIRVCCFEVGQEVADLFGGQYPGCLSLTGRNGKYRLDLTKVLDTQINLAGIDPSHCYDLAACTRCDSEQFYSYRAYGSAAGRMMATIGMPGSRIRNHK